MTADVVGLITLSVTLGAQLMATVWWAASLTRRVEHIERWIDDNAHTAERLAALEQQIKALNAAIARVEHYLRQRGP
jgi:hypothetical protein